MQWSDPDWATMSQAERDAAYDNTGAAANGPALVQALVAASSTVRAASPSGLDQPYGEGERQRVDLFPGRPGAPCLVFIHGGYWQRLGRESVAALGEGVRAHGWSVALPGYTLAPAARLGAMVAEIRSALDWVARRAGGPLFVGGWSAGGHLAALALDHPAVVAGLCVSGLFELGPIRDTGLNTALRLTDAELATLSPSRLPVVAKPLAIAYGTAELPALVRQSRHFHALRAAAHAPGPLLPVPGANHFSVVDALRGPDGALTAALLALSRAR